MSRVLALTSPARGHLFPLVPILDALHARGHDVAVRTLSSEVAMLRERGFDAVPMDPKVEADPLGDHVGRTPIARLKRSVEAFARRAPLDAADLERAIAESRPDVLLVDVNAWGAAAVAEASGLPTAVWCPYPLPLPSRDVPPFGPGLRPARGPLGRLRDRMLRPALLGPVERIVLGAATEVRGRLGLPPVTELTELYAGADVLLYLTAEPFEYPRTDWPTNVVMVGPCDWDPPMELPTWLTDDDRPTVLVTTSSEFQEDRRLAEVALRALADEPVHVVVTVPSAEVASFQAPANAHVSAFVPHGAVLEQAVCAVTHGGMGATQKALARGVPVVAVPFGRDQLEVARRVEVAGAGVRLPSGRLRPDRLRDAVRRATEMRDGADRIAAAFADAGGASAAADHVEALLSSRRPVG